MWSQPELIRSLVEARAEADKVATNAIGRPFAVEVPVASLWLLGYYTRTNQLVLMTTAEFKHGKVDIPKHRTFTSDALYILAEVARRYKGKSN